MFAKDIDSDVISAFDSRFLLENTMNAYILGLSYTMHYSSN